MKKMLVAAIPFLMLPSLCASSGVANAAGMRLTAQLRGMNEVGKPGASHGTGTATISVNMSTDKLCYTLKVSGFTLPAIAAHIHAGRAGKNGPVVVPFPTAPSRTGRASGCTTVRASLLKAITGHPSSYYVNVHTAQYPDGAVRGQLM